jgi:alpha-mannosidase
LKPHGVYSDADAKRFGMEQTTPLLLIPVNKNSKSIKSLVTLGGSENAIITSFKPSADKKAWMIRMFNSSNNPEDVNLTWGEKKPATVSLSSPLEEKGAVAPASFKLVPWEILTIRAELK